MHTCITVLTRSSLFFVVGSKSSSSRKARCVSATLSLLQLRLALATRLGLAYRNDQATEKMETVRRDLHQTTAAVSGLLTKYSKLAASASTSYSSSGLLKDDLTRRKEELETEIDGTMDTVSWGMFYSACERAVSC